METLWFCIVTFLIAAYVLLDGFDLGAGIVQLFVSRDEREASQVLQSIGPVWDGNEVWLLVAGGAILVAFPILCASAFSGFYLSLMIVLWLLILRGLAIEFRRHIDSPLWRPLCSTVFGLSSSALALLFGVALGNVIRGVPLDQDGYFFLPLWTNLSPWGTPGIIDWYTLLVGVASFAALAVHGALWVALKADGNLQERTRRFARQWWMVSVASTGAISVASFAIQPNLRLQLQQHSWGGIFPAAAILGMIGVRAFSHWRDDLRAFLSSGLFLAALLASAAFTMFPNVLFSSTGPERSLTIFNAAAAEHGLAIGLYWLVPGIVLALGYSVLVYSHFAGEKTEAVISQTSQSVNS